MLQLKAGLHVISVTNDKHAPADKSWSMLLSPGDAEEEAFAFEVKTFAPYVLAAGALLAAFALVALFRPAPLSPPIAGASRDS